MIYTGNTRFSNFADFDVVANEAYDDISGAYALLEDCAQNEQSIFEAALNIDIQEAAYYNGMISESSFEIVTEGVLSSFFDKIKTFVKKVWEKIKGIFTHFIAKLRSFYMDGKSFYNKYYKTVLKKDLSDFKYKYREWKSFEPDYVKASDELHTIVVKGFKDAETFEAKDKLDINEDEYNKNKYKYKFSGFDKDGHRVYYDAPDDKRATWQKISGTTKLNDTIDDNIKKYIDDMESFRDKMYSYLINTNASDSSYLEYLEDAMFDDEDEFEGSKHKEEIMSVVRDEKDTLKELKDNHDEFEKAQKNVIKFLDNEEKRLIKEKDNPNKKMLKVANACSTLISAQQQCASKVYSAVLTNTKKHISECKAIFVKMVAYKDKNAPVKTESYLEDVYESALFEAESTLFGY